MTTSSERNVARSRGKTLAARATASRIAALKNVGLAFVFEDDDTAIVEGQYRFNLDGSHWHRLDDPSVHGYLVATLLADFRELSSSEKPAVGRDSAASSELTTSGNAPEAVAESTAGSNSWDMLKEMPAWP
jgi:hypothetical protein